MVWCGDNMVYVCCIVWCWKLKDKKKQKEEEEEGETNVVICWYLAVDMGVKCLYPMDNVWSHFVIKYGTISLHDITPNMVNDVAY